MGKGGLKKGGRAGKPSQATFHGALSRLMEPAPAPGIPTWNGDPELFPAFEQSCDWYLASLKPNEKPHAVARVWSNLRGSAKLAVGRQKAGAYQGDNGLAKLLAYLAGTPLAKQALPDAYQKIDSYRGIKRMKFEGVATYVL